MCRKGESMKTSPPKHKFARKFALPQHKKIPIIPATLRSLPKTRQNVPWRKVRQGKKKGKKEKKKEKKEKKIKISKLRRERVSYHAHLYSIQQLTSIRAMAAHTIVVTGNGINNSHPSFLSFSSLGRYFCD